MGHGLENTAICSRELLKGFQAGLQYDLHCVSEKVCPGCGLKAGWEGMMDGAMKPVKGCGNILGTNNNEDNG